MDEGLVRVYVRHIEQQAFVGMRAVRGMNQALDTDLDAFWAELQSFAVAAGNVGKALWGAGNKHEEERAPVRQALAVSDSSPLRPKKGRSFRNDIEHLDERIATWWERSPNRKFYDRRLWHPSMTGPREYDSFFRVYEPTNAVAYFWGDEYHLEPVAAELDRLQVAAAHYRSQDTPPS